LDVLDGLDVLKIAVAYKDSNGQLITRPPQAADDFEGLEPIYEEMAGWNENTADVTVMSDLPPNALAYLKRIESLLGIPIDMLSTGPERDSTIILRDPFTV
jgi:adenylosuccinate synthase